MRLGVGDRQRHQLVDCLAVDGFSACQDEAERASLIVCAGVDLARKAAAAFFNRATDIAVTLDDFAAIATDCSTTLANIRLSISRRIFDHRNFVRHLPQHQRDQIKIITRMKDQELKK